MLMNDHDQVDITITQNGHSVNQQNGNSRLEKLAVDTQHGAHNGYTPPSFNTPEEEIAYLRRENEQLKNSVKYLKRSKKHLEFREGLDSIPNKLFSPTDKLLAGVLESEIHLKKEEDPRILGFYSVRIGNKPYKSNLMGMTGLSHKTIAETLLTFHESGLIERRLKAGTPGNNFEDAELFIRFTDLWKPETMQRLNERNIGYTRIAVCPECTSQDIHIRNYICHDCGATFPKPLYMTVQNEEENEQEPQPQETQSQQHENILLPAHSSEQQPRARTEPKEWSEFDHPYVETSISQDNERRQAGEQRIEQQRDVHHVALQSALERRGLTRQDVARREKPQPERSEPAPQEPTTETPAPDCSRPGTTNSNEHEPVYVSELASPALDLPQPQEQSQHTPAARFGEPVPVMCQICKQYTSVLDPLTRRRHCTNGCFAE